MSWPLAEIPLRKALFSRLNGAILHGGSAVPVFDFVEERSGFPRILLSDYQEQGGTNSSGFETEAGIDIEIWSALLGSDEVGAIAAAVHLLLTSSPLSLEDGWQEALAERESYSTSRVTAGDGEVFRLGVLTMRYVLGKEE